MRQVYRIIVTPYHFDTWSVFTEDAELFNTLKPARCVEDAITLLGVDVWEELVDGWDPVECPYVLLGEIIIRQYD